MVRRSFFYSLLLVAGMMVPTCAAGTDAPNKPDVRLQQKVTYEAKHKPVKLILADLSKMAGVTLKAGASDQDWQVRDRKMNIFVRDLPLLTLMNSMARAMEFTWDKNVRVDPPNYRMYMDRKLLAAAEAKRSQAEAEFRQYMMGRRAEFVDYVRNIPDYSPEELERLKKDSPYLYLLHQRGNDKLMKALLDEVPGYEEAYMTWKRILNPPTTILSDSTLEMVLSGMKSFAAARPGRGQVPADFDLEKLKKGRMRLTVPTEELIRDDTRWCFGGIAFMDDQEYYIQQLQDPKEPFGNLISSLDIAGSEGQKSFESIIGDHGEVVDQLARQDTRNGEESEGCEPLVDHPDEPWMHAKVKLELDKNDPNSLRNVLESLAKASGCNVVSDSFNLTRVVGSVSNAEQTLVQVLSTISDNYGYNWNKHDSILEFRDRNWFRRRRTQIPDEWMERWRENFKTNGEAVLEDIAQMAALPFEQLDENVVPDPVLGGCKDFVWTIRNGRGLLTIYNSFTPSQRRSLLKGGVPFDSLTPEQQAVAIETFQPMDTCEWNKPRFWENPEESLIFHGSYSQTEEGERAFILTATGNDNKPWYGHLVAFRKYIAPPEPETAKKSGS
jgi:hypothetical protein